MYVSNPGSNTLRGNKGTIHHTGGFATNIITIVILMWVVFGIERAVVGAGITTSNVFYGLGIFTAVVVILRTLTEVQIPSYVKVVVPFSMAFVLIGLGYHLKRRTK